MICTNSCICCQMLKQIRREKYEKLLILYAEIDDLRMEIQQLQGYTPKDHTRL